MSDDKKIEPPAGFQKPSERITTTAAVPRISAREEWERAEAVAPLPVTAEDEARIRRLSRRSFLWAGVASAGLIGGIWAFDKYAPQEANPQDVGADGKASRTGAKKAFRVVQSFNDALAGKLFFSQNHRAREFPREAAIMPKNNYKGDTPTVDLNAWMLTLKGEPGRTKRVLTLAEIKTLPQVSQTTELKCIEGWSAVANWTGVRLRDFVEKYPPPAGTRYIAMRSEPEGWEGEWYYVGIDMESALHPQAILAYALNDKPLEADHGAPLRLIMPHKYGIKNIKLITSITYSNHRPADYWHELGYDYYAGL